MRNLLWTQRSQGIAIYPARQKSLKSEDWHYVERLLESGIGEPIPNERGAFIQSEDATNFDATARDKLGLPDPWPGFFRLATRSIPNARDFNAAIQIHDELAHQIYKWNLEGPILSIGAREYYLLTPAQFAILTAFDNWNKVEEKTEADHLRLLHTLSEAADNGCLIDLRNMPDIDIQPPGECFIDAKQRQDGSIDLTPMLSVLLDDGDASPSEVREMLRKRISQIDQGGDEAIVRVGKKVIVLSEEQTQVARKILEEKPRVSAEESQAFYQDPSKWLADHVFTHGEVEFLPRVSGVGEWTDGYMGSGGELGDPIDWFYKQPEALDNRDSERQENESSHDEPTSPEEEWDDEETTEDEVPREEAPLVPLIQKNDDELTWGIPSTADFSGEPIPFAFDFEGFPRPPFPHQVEAVKWLASHTARAGEPAPWKENATAWGAGALFADDMGLGKTYSTLLFIGAWYEVWRERIKQDPPACLVVAPLSLAENWKEEVEKAFPPDSIPFSRIVQAIPAAELRSYYATATGKDVVNEGSVKQCGLKFGDKTEESLDYPGTIVITTYQTLRDYRFSFAGCSWSVVVFDEAQYIKNPNALQTVAAKSLKGFFRVALTGTPVENHLGDLWCLMDAVEPGALGSFTDFRNQWIRPIKKDPTQMEHIGRALRDYLDLLILRRTKEANLEALPKKNIERSWIPMSSEQEALYDEILSLANSSNEALSTKTQNNHHLACMWELRRITLHPDLMGGGSPKPFRNAKSSRQYLSESGKLAWLLDTLDEIRDRGEKALIFSVQKQLQELLASHLGGIYGVKVPVINGDTKAASKAKPNETRLGLIKSFCDASGFGVCVLSPIAAGAGLNIVAANHVIHLERHWNPAKEDQATDRAYRIGQEKDVKVHLPILMHSREHLVTFDIGLERLISQKRSLAGSLGLIPPGPVSDQELFDSVLSGNHSTSEEPSKARTLELEDALNMSWELFEALIALLYERESDEVILTPCGRDGGADSIVLGHQPTNTSFLVQCKHTRREKLDSEHAVREVVGALPIVKSRLNQAFGRGVVHTTAAKFSSRTKRAAKDCSVDLRGRKWLKKRLENHPVTISEVVERNSKRRRI